MIARPDNLVVMATCADCERLRLKQPPHTAYHPPIMCERCARNARDGEIATATSPYFRFDPTRETLDVDVWDLIQRVNAERLKECTPLHLPAMSWSDYFCSSCWTEVTREQTTCPKCGATFAIEDDD